MTLEELADALRDLESMRRVVVCPVGMGLKVEALVLRYGMDHLWTVQESVLADGRIYLINHPEGFDL